MMIFIRNEFKKNLFDVRNIEIKQRKRTSHKHFKRILSQKESKRKEIENEIQKKIIELKKKIVKLIFISCFINIKDFLFLEI